MQLHWNSLLWDSFSGVNVACVQFTKKRHELKREIITNRLKEMYVTSISVLSLRKGLLASDRNDVATDQTHAVNKDVQKVHLVITTHFDLGIVWLK